MVSETLGPGEDPDLSVTPRSRREQLIEVVDNYKEKLRQIKGQVSVERIRDESMKGEVSVH